MMSMRPMAACVPQADAFLLFKSRSSCTAIHMPVTNDSLSRGIHRIAISKIWNRLTGDIDGKFS
jgi:hypothetical protein